MQSYIYNIDAGDVYIDKAELALRLKTPRDFKDDTIEKCIVLVKKSIKPACAYVKVPCNVTGENVDLGFMTVSSKDLSVNLSGCTEAYVVAVTLGVETDRLIQRLSLVSAAEGFVADAAASAMAESLMDIANTHLRTLNELRPRFSPGYGDLDVSVQRSVLEILGADKILGIKLGDNYLMTPRKSITAICGIIN